MSRKHTANIFLSKLDNARDPKGRRILHTTFLEQLEGVSVTAKSVTYHSGDVPLIHIGDGRSIFKPLLGAFAINEVRTINPKPCDLETTRRQRHVVLCNVVDELHEQLRASAIGGSTLTYNVLGPSSFRVAFQLCEELDGFLNDLLGPIAPKDPHKRCRVYGDGVNDAEQVEGHQSNWMSVSCHPPPRTGRGRK